MSIDSVEKNRKNWNDALLAVERQLDAANLELDDVRANRYQSGSPEYDQAWLDRKLLHAKILDMRLAIDRGDNYLVWKLSRV